MSNNDEGCVITFARVARLMRPATTWVSGISRVATSPTHRCIIPRSSGARWGSARLLGPRTCADPAGVTRSGSKKGGQKRRAKSARLNPALPQEWQLALHR